MRLLRAELEGFRNYARAVVEPSGDVTALIGPNGQGKTNAIEGIFLVSALRPLRAVPRHALVRAGEREARVRVRVSHQRTGLVHELQVALSAGQRRLEKDGKPVSAGQFLGGLVAIAFTPDDLQLPKGGPEARRRFLDRALLDARPSYLAPALRYAKAMKDRNRLLSRQAPDDEVDPFDAILAREGAIISLAREQYVTRIAERVTERFRDIARPCPELRLRYATNVPRASGGLREQGLLEALLARRRKDRARGTTSVGPHLDDLELELDGGSARERASQGQHRALVLALKLVEIEELARDLGEPPLLLLDDMSSELDATRTRQLFDEVRALDGQVILTSTVAAETLLEALGAARSLVVQRVAEGTLGPPEAVPPASAVRAGAGGESP